MFRGGGSLSDVRSVGLDDIDNTIERCFESDVPVDVSKHDDDVVSDNDGPDGYLDGVRGIAKANSNVGAKLVPFDPPLGNCDLLVELLDERERAFARVRGALRRRRRLRSGKYRHQYADEHANRRHPSRPLRRPYPRHHNLSGSSRTTQLGWRRRLR